LAGLVLANETPVEVLYVYLGISMLTFAAYWRDKSAAQKGDWRIREDTLHAFSLVGGWLGPRQFRHPEKPGTVTVAGKPGVEIPVGTLKNIFKQARLKYD